MRTLLTSLRAPSRLATSAYCTQRPTSPLNFLVARSNMCKMRFTREYDEIDGLELAFSDEKQRTKSNRWVDGSNRVSQLVST